MQLTDQAVVASGCSAERAVTRSGLGQRDRVTCLRDYASVPVSSLDSGAIKDENDQQQTKPTFYVSRLVLKCVEQHAGHCQLC